MIQHQQQPRTAAKPKVNADSGSVARSICWWLKFRPAQRLQKANTREHAYPLVEPRRWWIHLFPLWSRLGAMTTARALCRLLLMCASAAFLMTLHRLAPPTTPSATVWDAFSGRAEYLNEISEFLQILDEEPCLRSSAMLRTLLGGCGRNWKGCKNSQPLIHMPATVVRTRWC